MWMNGLPLRAYLATTGAMVACCTFALLLATGTAATASIGPAIAGGVGGAIGAAITRSRRERRRQLG